MTVAKEVEYPQEVSENISLTLKENLETEDQEVLEESAELLKHWDTTFKFIDQAKCV